MELKPCEENDILFHDIVKLLNVMEYGIDVTEAYELYVDGDKKYLIIDDLSFFIVNLENNCFSSVDIFEVDENNKISFLLFHGKNIVLDKGNNRVFMFDDYKNDEMDEETEDLTIALDYYEDDDYPITHSITINPIDEVRTRYSSYNANVCYTFDNLDTRVRLHMYGFYNASFSGNDRINEGYFKEPYLIKTVPLNHGLDTFDDRSYYLVEWYKDYPYYFLALVKTVGLFRALVSSYKNGFQFYYNKPIMDEEGEVYLNNLITSGMFDFEDIKKRLMIRGLSTDIPNELIDLYNGETSDYKYCLDILEEYSKRDCMILKKKNGVSK